MPGKKAYPELVRNILNRYKYVLLVAALGVVLLTWPCADQSQTQVQAQAQEEMPDTDIEGVEKKLESLLSMIEGVGDVKVMLTLYSSPEWVYADEKKLSSDTGSAGTGGKTDSENHYVVIEDSSGNERLVPVRQKYAQYKGALVVCRGADNASVRLAVVNAVKSVTGLTADCITVEKMG